MKIGGKDLCTATVSVGDHLQNPRLHRYRPQRDTALHAEHMLQLLVPDSQRDDRLNKGRWQTLSNAAIAFAGAVYFVGFGIGVASDSWNVLGALLVVPVLALLTVPLARRFAVWDKEPELALLIAVAFVAKMTGALVRYFVAYYVYQGSADATGYDIVGRQLAPLYRSGDFSAHVALIPGTGFIKVLTGLVYAVAGTSRLGGFMVFSWIGFLG